VSEKYTSVRIPGTPGYAAHGYVGYNTAVDAAYLHYVQQRDIAQRAIDAINVGDVEVYRHTGIYRIRNRVRVHPERDGR
jgi:hypothetical protein